jgi:4-methyl-5(b-hydroxyethyl)-thiazole monophosphate biosynthesis
MDGLRRRQLADFGADVRDEPIVRDGNIVTSTSPATAADVALELVALLTDKENAGHIRKLMGFGSGGGSL